MDNLNLPMVDIHKMMKLVLTMKILLITRFWDINLFLKILEKKQFLPLDGKEILLDIVKHKLIFLILLDMMHGYLLELTIKIDKIEKN